jgi:phospholipid/cholesterol/gamma-HCH transport system ATP-binding protein
MVGAVMDAIRIVGLKKAFGNEYVLNGIDLEIQKGLVTVIIGFSGTGKSVLLKHILGLLKPTEGEVEVLGKTYSEMNDDQLTRFRRNFGVLFQNAALFDDMTAFENVAFPLREHRRHYSEREVCDVVEARLKVVGIEPKDYHKLPSQLSGGMRKRVGLARALALDPEILMYDEPTTGLDPIMTEMVDNLILSTHRHREGLTSVIVTHDLPAAFRIGDRVAMLHKGRVLLQGTPKDFLDSQDELVKSFVSKGIDRGVRRNS